MALAQKVHAGLLIILVNLRQSISRAIHVTCCIHRRVVINIGDAFVQKLI